MLNDAIKVISNKAGELMHDVKMCPLSYFLHISGLSPVFDKLGEFSLAWKDENSDDWIDGDIIYTNIHKFTMYRINIH